MTAFVLLQTVNSDLAAAESVVVARLTAQQTTKHMAELQAQIKQLEKDKSKQKENQAFLLKRLADQKEAKLEHEAAIDQKELGDVAVLDNGTYKEALL